MSVFENHKVSRTVKKIKALLYRNAGLARRVTSGKNFWRQVTSKSRKITGLAPDQVGGAVRLANPSAESTPVFFVVGYQKSGTTWLMKMLDAHPEILCQGEGRPFGRDWRQEHLKQKRASYPPTSLYNAILSSEDLRYWVERSVWTRRDDPDEHLDNLTRLAVEYFLTQKLLKTGKRMVGDKTVLHEPGIIEEIGKICPGARVIHIIRDGRDVAVSQMHHRWNQAGDRGGIGALTPEQLAKREAYRKDPQELIETGGGIFPDGWVAGNAAKWSARVDRAMQDGLALLGANYAEVKYEELLERPEEEMERLLKFLGAEASEQTVRQCVGAASFSKLAGGRERGQEAASFFRKGIAGDWQNVFTGRDKRDFKAAAGNLLLELGYEEDNDW